MKNIILNKVTELGDITDLLISHFDFKKVTLMQPNCSTYQFDRKYMEVVPLFESWELYFDLTITLWIDEDENFVHHILWNETGIMRGEDNIEAKINKEAFENFLNENINELI